MGTNIVSAATSTISSASVSAAGLDGRETIVATATISADTLNNPTSVGDIVSGTYEVNALLCENPWPAVNDYPYHETSTNFSFSYCRDAGEPGVENDLPALEVPIDVVSISTSIYQELIFKVAGTKDAIGVRVLQNPGYLSPIAWFQDQGFTGAPSSTTVDGYEAAQDGTTVYVSAANQTGDIYPNIYVISYNDDASAEAQTIFDLVLANWKFNANDEVVTDVNLCQTTDGNYVQDTTGAFRSCTLDGDCHDECVDDVCSKSGGECVVDGDCPLAVKVYCDAE